MAKGRLSGTLAVILHADVASSTALVQQDKELAHERIQESFQRFSTIIETYRGHVLELRGDALLASFERAADAISASLSFQADNIYHISRLKDDIRPAIRVGIAMGEVIIADNTVTGSGVVQAQRVEQLADPGGVCITASIHESLSRSLPFDLENLGEQLLKGFDDPVRVYRVELSTGQSAPAPQHDNQRQTFPEKSNLIVATIVIALVLIGGSFFWFKSQLPQQEPASLERMAYPLPDKPSIAVLPFSNMSDDKQQEYFADGMTEDLITDISKVTGLFVIARNSVFTYKGKAVKIRQVAEELGVRYVMEGSVRRVGNQVRINAQLIDATTGGHIWAERYDGSLDDVFSMQDKIAQRIVTALSVTLTGQEQNNPAQSETSNSEAYDAFLRGWERYRQGTPDDLTKAASYFEQAIELDPEYGRAHSALAAVYWKTTWNGWWRSFDLLPWDAIEQSRLSLVKAMEHPSALTHQIASERAAYLRRKPDKALDEAQIAIGLDANDPAGHLAMSTALLKAGRAAEAVESVRTAMRLDPHFPTSYLTRLGQAEFAMGQYENAALTLETAAKRNPDDDWTFVYLAATYGHLGQVHEAETAMKKANSLRAQAGWGALTVMATHDPYFKWVGNLKPLKEGLRKAGLEVGGKWRELVYTGDSGTVEVKGAKTIDLKTAKALHERDVIFIDVSFIWVQHRIPDSYHLSIWTKEFNEVRLLELMDKTQEAVIYHGGGEHRRGTTAIAQAVDWGFRNIYYFPDGFNQWKEAGYPVLTKE